MAEPDWVRIGSDWLQLLLAGLCGGGLALWASIGQRNRSLATQIKDLERRLDERLKDQGQRLGKLEIQAPHLPRPEHCADHKERVGRVEERLKHTAGTKEMADIYAVVNPLREGLASLRTEVHGLRQAMEGVTRGVETITASLLRRDEARHPS